MSQNQSVPQVIFAPSSVTRLNSAFDLLAQALGELSPNGTPVKAAAIKPTMQRLGLGSFDEKELNYENFRSFLKDAADQGVIVLDSETDKDYLVSSADVWIRDEFGLDVALFDDNQAGENYKLNGKDLNDLPHVKVDDVKHGKASTGRIHFVIDSEKGQIMLTYLGRHR